MSTHDSESSSANSKSRVHASASAGVRSTSSITHELVSYFRKCSRRNRSISALRRLEHVDQRDRKINVFSVAWPTDFWNRIWHHHDFTWNVRDLFDAEVLRQFRPVSSPNVK